MGEHAAELVAGGMFALLLILLFMAAVGHDHPPENPRSSFDL